MAFRSKYFDNVCDIDKDKSTEWVIRDDLDITDYGSVFDQISKFLQFGSIDVVDYGEEEKELNDFEDTALDMAEDHIEREEIIRSYLNIQKGKTPQPKDDKKEEIKQTVDKKEEKQENIKDS